MLSSNTLAGRITAPNAKLFTIRLRVSKTTSMNIEYIILITNSLNLARRVIDSLVYSGQVDLLVVCSALIII